MKNSVTCAINVNDYDQDVVDLAATFAKQFGDKLQLLHVTLFPNTANRTVYAYVGSSSVYQKEERLLQAIAATVKGVEVQPHHISGIPVEEVLGFAERNQPRLLILGTHGRHGLAKIFGSVASKVLRNASCPVMVLRQRKNSRDFEVLPESDVASETAARSSRSTKAKTI